MKKRIDAAIASGLEVHSMLVFVGFDDGNASNPKDGGAKVCIGGCPRCLIPNIMMHLKDFAVRMDDHEASHGTRH